jgi:hypothetical protein
MTADNKTLERIEALEDLGREMVERDQIHGVTVEYEFDVCRFDEWRRKVVDLLFSLEGCEDIYYQRFSKDVTRPHIKDLERGLRVLAAVRDNVEAQLKSRPSVPPGGATLRSRPSVAYH